MDIYRVPVTWESYGVIKIEANSPEEALDKVKNNLDLFELPFNINYVEDSFNVSSDNDDEMLAMIEIDDGRDSEEIYIIGDR